jgi:hypothetical protein
LEQTKIFGEAFSTKEINNENPAWDIYGNKELQIVLT